MRRVCHVQNCVMFRALQSVPRTLSSTAIVPARMASAAGRPVDLKGVLLPDPLTMASLNPRIKEMEYAVRGPLVIRALQLEKELKEGVEKPFDSVIRANIGDAHAMGQVPITFIRQVLAACCDPHLLEKDVYPADVVERARLILSGCGGGSVGSYTLSNGIELIRKHVAEFISVRDGFRSYPENIFLSNGASEAIRSLLKLFVSGPTARKTGVMIPIPQYPLYSASISEFGLHPIGYYLNEANKWELQTKHLEAAFVEAELHSVPRIICIINPGNPTGQVLSRRNIETVLDFAASKGLFVFADEVYQENVYAEGCVFHSFRQVMLDKPHRYGHLGLASFYSISKGYMGECGLRGGYAEVINLDPDVMVEYKKSISAKLCSTAIGQAAMDCVVRPPARGDASFESFDKERRAQLKSLGQRAKLVEERLNSIDGIECNPVQGAMYAFPRLQLPPRAVDAAQAAGKEPDFYYAEQLLEQTGVCVVPGSGFGQVPGTYHFRTTILPQPEMIEDMLTRVERFHADFTRRHV